MKKAFVTVGRFAMPHTEPSREGNSRKRYGGRGGRPQKKKEIASRRGLRHLKTSKTIEESWGTHHCNQKPTPTKPPQPPPPPHKNPSQKHPPQPRPQQEKPAPPPQMTQGQGECLTKRNYDPAKLKHHVTTPVRAIPF